MHGIDQKLMWLKLKPAPIIIQITAIYHTKEDRTARGRLRSAVDQLRPA